jgi:hypothetical protein
MRTTLTLDDDVAIQLRQLCAAQKARLKTVVNRALRAGLGVLTGAPRPRRRGYRTIPCSLGRPRLPNLDNIAEVLAIAEEESHR